MKQGLALLFFLSLFSLPVFSQSNGNEWIDYDQFYYRIKISQDGIYRIDKNTLINAGFDVSINPKRIQLFSKETEQAIYIKGEVDGVFNDDDFIEFVAVHNNGWLDSLLYEDEEYQLNPHYSLYNDTLCYYLTYSSPSEITNLRSINVVDQNFDGYSGSDFCMVSTTQHYSSFYSVGKRNLINNVTEPRYLAGEGYGKKIESTSLANSFNTSNRYNGLSAPAAILSTRFASANNPSAPTSSGNHHFQVRVNNDVLFDSTFFGYESFSLNENIDIASLSNTTQITIQSGIGIPTDHMALGFVQFTFPHSYYFEGQSKLEFRAKANSETKLKVEIENFSGTNPIVYSTGNEFYRGKAYTNNDEFRFLIPQNEEDYLDCYISSEEEIQAITNIQKVSQSGQFTDFREANLTNAFLIITHPSLWESATSYSNYRNQNYSSLLIDINELYDQYGGGIIKHPLAIKRLIKDLIENWDEKPNNLFLIGKSISPVSTRSSLSYLNSVPTMGYPPSDNLLSAGLNGSVLEPAIPTGRLAAKTNDDVIAYLNKVILFEGQLPDMWMKNTLHFGGGSTSYEQESFSNYLASYETIIEDTSMGAQVYTYLKNTSTPIEIVVNDQITELINGGVSLMTFFGHANGSGFDVNIDQPENYENYGKYPLILASSCYTGNIHSTGISNSEKFVLIPEKGSIGYLATVNTGIASELNKFNTKFYTHNFKSHYNSSIGDNVIRAIQDMPDNPLSNSIYIKESTALEMTLHGDPSIVLNAFEKPDLAVTNDEIFFEPELLTADIDSFTVSIVLKNLGRATHQPFTVELIRSFPGNLGDSIYSKQVNGLLNYDTLSFTLASHHPISNGINNFRVLVNISATTIDEDNYLNNTTPDKEYIINSGQIVPIFPYNQSIISNSSPVFSAYHGSLDSTNSTHVFQLSQSNDFSTIIEEGSVAFSDGVLLWDPISTLQNNSVYYWRCAKEEDAMEGIWRNRSFEYISDSTGWGQSQSTQFNTNDFQLLNYQESINNLQFTEGFKTLRCNLYGSRNINANEVLLDLNIVDYGGCGSSITYLFVMVFDPNTLEAWGTNYAGANPDHDFGNNVNCRQRVVKYFAFNQNSQVQMESLYNMLNDEIPDGHHVLVYTYSIAQFDYWDAYQQGLYTLFTDWGSSNINVNAEDHPFIFYTQKGNTAVTQEVMGIGTHDTLTLSVNLPIVGNSGKINIEDMGKTNSISAVQWSFSEGEMSDQFVIDFNQDDSPTPLFSSDDPSFNQVINTSTSYSNSITGEITLSDTANYTPLQFEDLRLFYDPPGDAALNANLEFVFANDSINEGENIEMIIGITNPTPYALDSLLTRISIVDANNTLKKIVEKRLDTLGAYQSIIDTIRIESIGLSGFNKLQYELNPLNGMGIEDQAEQNRYNNKISLPFYVQNDQTQPIVDVTFDGMYIMNGEIITPEPQIVIQLKDDSEYLVFSEISDTTNLSIFIKAPSGNLEKVNYSEPNLQFEFGTGDNNHMRVIYNPTFMEDGKYLMLVQAIDKSGNSSGNRDYEIEFEIIRKAAITQVLNYPNPFVNKTHFVFTLTGTRIPDVFTIRIYTATGKIVKEIHKQELGTIRIGNNITDYYWDGTDMYGDQLANGVYFYRVDISYSDENLETIESEADQYFKQGMGKMYLMR